MKILLTANSIAGAGAAVRMRTGRLGTVNGINKHLRELGHDVDWRLPKDHDRADDYDLIWATIISPSSLNAPSSLSLLMLLEEAVQKRVPTIVYLDDWQYLKVFAGFRRFNVREDLQIMKTVGGQYFYRSDISWAIENRERILAFCRAWTTRDPWLMDHVLLVMPLFDGWGDRSIIENQIGLSVEGHDATPFLVERVGYDAFAIPEEKERRWLLASLVDHQKWNERVIVRGGLEWPVDVFGPKKLGAPVLMSEAEVYQATLERWGSLSPAYGNDGSGWFRARFPHSGMANSIIYAGRKDQEALGGAYIIPDPREIELMEDGDLARIGREQGDIQRSVMVTDVGHSYASLTSLLEKAMDPGGPRPYDYWRERGLDARDYVEQPGRRFVPPDAPNPFGDEVADEEEDE